MEFTLNNKLKEKTFKSGLKSVINFYGNNIKIKAKGISDSGIDCIKVKNNCQIVDEE